jgi:hypothetical protein
VVGTSNIIVKKFSLGKFGKSGLDNGWLTLMLILMLTVYPVNIFAKNRKRNEMIKYQYQVVLDGEGKEYYEAEQDIISKGDQVVPFLQERAQSDDPLRNLITNVLIEQVTKNKLYNECIQYLIDIENKSRVSAVGTPRINGVVNYLLKHFEAKVAPLLAVHLIKMGSVWPHWKVMSTIVYLEQANDKASIDPLIRFLHISDDEEQINMAIKCLSHLGDKNTYNKLQSELKKVEQTKKAIDESASGIMKKMIRQNTWK